MKRVLVICGPTASGKTKLAIDCARLLNSEVISADSQLVYKGLNIGTAKPNAEEMRGIKHHMIDVVEPTQNFSVSDYERLAKPILDDLIKKDKVPVICGGTGFYINSLLFGLSYGNTAANDDIRKKYNNFVSKNGKEALYNKLKEVDAATAEKLHVNDVKRVIRALEIYEVSGKKKSDQNDGLIPKLNYTAIVVNYPREELYARIDERVDEMFACGLLNEVKYLLSQGIDENCQCMQAIGYKEIATGLKNGDNHSTMCDIIKRNTRHYAKRQITFFKKLPNIVWLEPNAATAETVMEILNEAN
ncbi:MAG: tRNA (adenosine(37)-N6)-dimethylallyltransferase MiaA [Clostridia bacterium]|nr:tRNA (adenosine(37)-N6)-dimethylallyltransferase MiaA [Clostridia bacterium]